MKKTKVFFLLLLFFAICNTLVVYGVEETHKPNDDEWFADAKSHYKKCVVDGCDERFEEEEHTGGTHDNKGKCSICDMKYQTHNLDRDKLTIDEFGHTYECSYDSCKKTFYSEHEQSNYITWDGISHWYRCTNSDCTKRYSEQEHYGGENEDGVCKVCRRKYEGELDKFYLKDMEDGFVEIKEVGDKLKLEVEYYPENLADDKFLWEIEDEEIATVNQDGIIEGISEGITVLHIKWNEEEITYVVYVDVEFFELEVENGVITEGEKTQVNIATENIVGDIEWRVSNDEWASISKKGVVTVNKGGGNEIKIFAITKNMIGIAEIKIEHGKVAHEEDGGICEICHEEIPGHELSEEYDFDEDKHWKVCENRSCRNKEEIFEEGNHTSSTSCKVCEWTKKQEKPIPKPEPEPDKPDPKPDPEIGKDPQPENSGWSWYNTHPTYHWKVSNATGNRIGNMVVHKYVNGKCECGKIEEKQECNHDHEGTHLEYVDDKHHNVVYDICGKIKVANQLCPGEGCECRKLEKTETETSLDLPIKVYYVEEDCLVSVEGNIYNSIKTEVISQNTPKFSWTMSTIPNQTFFSGEVSNDGTIRFWYENGEFKAELVEGERTVLSEEVIIDITLIDGTSRDFETIKLIKNGPPRSYCQIFLEDTVISSNENKLKLLIATKYNEFTDEQVRDAGEGEFPLYKIKNNTIKITNSDGSIINVPINPDRIEQVSVSGGSEDGSLKFNGYVAEITVNPLQEGTVTLKFELTTEYTLNKHKTLEKDRVYSEVVSVTKATAESTGGGGGGTGGGTGGGGTGGGGDSTGGGSSGSSAGLAVVGCLGLILIAFVGAKMFGHH